VRIGSENPSADEGEIAAYIADWLSRVPGARVEVQVVEKGRNNVIARIGPSGKAPALAYIAHMDTVPKGDGWSKNPFGGDIEDGMLFGRGACDMKSGLAAALVAFSEVARSRRELDREFIVCATVDEEGPLMKGAVHLAKEGIVGPETLIVAPEPSDLQVIVSHKGLIWFEIECHGKLAHAGNPKVGVDAVQAGAAFVNALQSRVEQLSYDHPMVGPATATVSAFNGGIKTNVVPDYARIEVDLRLPGPMSLAQAHELVAAAAAEAQGAVSGARIEYRQINNDRPPIDANVSSALVNALKSAVGEVTGSPAVVAGFPAYTDASIIAANTGNRDGIVFGPGRLAQAHTADEYVPVDQIIAATEVLKRTAIELCCKSASN
jgi:succinyl-diaminopimelate desuccinylase